MIEVKVTIGGEIITFTMTIKEWMEKRDSLFVEETLEDKMYEIISDKINR
jgi:hypothetical protein